jgi:hypothetical protein
MFSNLFEHALAMVAALSITAVTFHELIVF